jgi:two-component system copper resistance phosphate regulon response regulator CusR
MRVLLVEDERRMAALLERTLREEGHQVIVAKDGREGYELARYSGFDVIVLDGLLPGMDGWTVARKLREQAIQTPILMLTARDAPAEIVKGLDSGADDYLTKPFSMEVLLARIRSVSRRGAIPRPTCLQVADVKLNVASREVTRGGQALNLTPREYMLLELLMRNAGRALSRDAIVESVWGFDSDVTGNTVEVFMRQLRLKVDAQETKLIHTVRGYGYILKEPSH